MTLLGELLVKAIIIIIIIHNLIKQLEVEASKDFGHLLITTTSSSIT